MKKHLMGKGKGPQNSEATITQGQGVPCSLGAILNLETGFLTVDDSMGDPSVLSALARLTSDSPLSEVTEGPPLTHCLLLTG